MTTAAIYDTGHVVSNRYEIKQFLASGGMQEVYIALDRVLRRQVALKTPKTGSAAKRFKRSAMLSARINHPFVAKTYDYFESDDRAFLVEEFIDGPDLERMRTEHVARFDPYLLAQCGHQLAKALAASHRVGVVHRDLKPNNVIVAMRNGLYAFKITDFGIAALAEAELDRAHKSEDTMASSSTMFGALPYMSPELIEDPKGAASPSDIWALGAILYTLQSGKQPYGQGLKAIPHIMSGVAPSRPEIVDQFPQYKELNNDLWKIIRSCFQMKGVDRPSADSLVSQFSTLCYSVYPRREGIIEKFRHSEGDYGFIAGDGTPIFFHRDSFYGIDPAAGLRVLFCAHPGLPRARAHPVVPLV
jgi:eukaryotic-like serine/threonine-protein kinase